ncbi:MAG: hypothetical protein ACT4QD_22730 [Acidobacteriota bacterium]
MRLGMRTTARTWIPLVVLVAGTAGCGGPRTPSSPSAPLILTFATPIPMRLVTCGPCEVPSTVFVIEHPVTIADPIGPGGSVEQVEVVVRNLPRNLEVGRNRRPNADHAYRDTHLPAGGVLTLEAGIVFPITPSRDELEVTVWVTLTDGRRQSRSAGVVMLAASGSVVR